MFQQRAHEVLKPLLRLEVSSPSAQVDAAKHYLAISRRHQRVRFFNYAIKLHRAALSANAGNDAEGAAVVASILHFEVGTRFFRDAVAGEDGSGDQLSMGKDVANKGESWGRKSHSFQRDKILNAMLAKPIFIRSAFDHLWLKAIAGGNLCHTMLMRVPHNPSDAGQGGNLLRGALGVTARHHDFCRWILSMDPA